MEELIVAGTVHTQYNFEPLTVAAEAIDAEQLVEISSPINTANVIKDDIEACKVTSALLPPEDMLLRIAQVICLHSDKFFLSNSLVLCHISDNLLHVQMHG